jgi:hypothetical protein
MTRSMTGAAVLCLMCQACSTTPQPVVEPITHIETVDNKIPVPVYCLDGMPKKPAFSGDAMLKAGSEGDVIRNLRIDRIERSDYEADLEAALRACLAPSGKSGS